MLVLGVESSCDECSVALVENGTTILAQEIASQIDIHARYAGVVPELASRAHVEAIVPVFDTVMRSAGVTPADIDCVAATNRPGLVGALQVGFSFAKALAWSRALPFVAVNHILAHLYAVQLVEKVEYPFLGLLVSGGHSILGIVHSPLEFEVLGASIDDAVGEAFDKVAKHFGLGYPGGKIIDDLAKSGDPLAFDFPFPMLHKSGRKYDVSYSGLKNAVINQRAMFRKSHGDEQIADVLASFQRVAVDILLRRVKKASRDTGIRRVVAGGGVAANSRLRASIAAMKDLDCRFPPLDLCADNAAMIAGVGFHLHASGSFAPLDAGVSARVDGYRIV